MSHALCSIKLSFHNGETNEWWNTLSQWCLFGERNPFGAPRCYYFVGRIVRIVQKYDTFSLSVSKVEELPEGIPRPAEERKDSSSTVQALFDWLSCYAYAAFTSVKRGRKHVARQKRCNLAMNQTNYCRKGMGFVNYGITNRQGR